MSRLHLAKIILPAIIFASACARVDSISAPSAASANSGVILGARSVNLSASVPGAVPSPAGLKACFAGETNGLDVVSNNVGAIGGGLTFSAGRFGQGFDLQSVNDGVVIPANASLNVGPGAGITMAAWIFPRGTSFGGAPGAGPIIEFEGGAHIWQHNQQGDNFGLFTNMAEGTATSQYHILQATGVIQWNGWQHVAATYNKSTGTIALYVNGVLKATLAAGTFNPNTSTGLRIGQRVVQFLSAPQYAFNGVIDEVQLYDRGLTGAEVAQLASATGTMCVPPAVAYQVTQMPTATGESGVPFSPAPTVVLLDAAGAIVSNSTAPVTVTASGGATLQGTTTVNAVGGIATFTDLAVAGAATTSLTFTSGTLPATGGPATSAPVTTTQVARRLGITTQPGGGQSGSTLSPQPVIQVRDAAGLPMPGATNVVTVSVASGTATLSGPTTATAVNATAAFSGLIVNGSGPVTLAFASTGLTGITSNSFSIAVLPATQIGILTQPAGAESGRPFTTQPVIEIRDASGARAATATGTVTAVVASGTGGTLAGTATATVVDGLATFANLQINGPGIFTLRFTFGALPAATSANIPVVQVFRQLALISSPASIISGVVMTPPFIGELRDGAGFKIETATNLIRMSLTSGNGTLAGVTEVSAVAGVVTFANMVATVTTGTAQFNFVLVDQGTSYGSVFASSNVITVLTNIQPSVLAGLVRDEIKLNSSNIFGSLQLLTGSDVTLNGNAGMSGTLFVPGMPSVKLTGHAAIGTTADGTGSTSPNNYQITLNGNAVLGGLTRRTGPSSMPVVLAPTAPLGTRSVSLNSPGDAVGAWATVRNLTVNGNYGALAVPAGNFGDVTVDGSGSIVLGVAGATVPSIYNIQKLKVNGNTSVQVVGPVVVTVGDDVSLNGNAGASSHPEWLTLKLYKGDFTLNGGTTAAIVIAPSGKITLNGNSSLTGGIAADDLTVNGTAVLRITKPVPTP